jgi:hypothetical protein
MSDETWGSHGKKAQSEKSVHGLKTRCVCHLCKQTIGHFLKRCDLVFSLERSRSDAPKEARKGGLKKDYCKTRLT